MKLCGAKWGLHDNRTACSECECESSIVVEMGETLDYESDTVWLCGSCLSNALDIIKAAGDGLRQDVTQYAQDGLPSMDGNGDYFEIPGGMGAGPSGRPWQ